MLSAGTISQSGRHIDIMNQMKRICYQFAYNALLRSCHLFQNTHRKHSVAPNLAYPFICHCT